LMPILIILVLCCSSIVSVITLLIPKPKITPPPLPPIPLPKGQFVRIEHTKPATVINLSEFEVLDKSYENLSKGKTVTASSVNASSPVANLVDGSYNNYTTINPLTENSWVEIDLGSEQEIRKFVMLNRYDGNKDKAVGIKVIIIDKNRMEVKTTPIIEKEQIRYSFEFKTKESDEEEVWKGT